MSMRGTTLVELLIATLIAALAVAGALTGLAQSQRSWRAAERMARMHERAQYVFATLEPELQMAGYFGTADIPQLSSDPLSTPGAHLACGADALLPLQRAVQVMQGSWSLPCPAQGRGARSGSDAVILHRASTRVASVADGALQLTDDAATPELRDLFVRIYYVAKASDGDARTPALRVKSLTAIAGEPAFIDTEVMPGVADLQIDLLPDAVAPRSVRVRLQVLPDAADMRGGEPLPVLALDRRFTLRNVRS
jgi:Tfp pilus assembly protein PilW